MAFVSGSPAVALGPLPASSEAGQPSVLTGAVGDVIDETSPGCPLPFSTLVPSLTVAVGLIGLPSKQEKQYI